MKIYLADDHNIVRNGLKLLLAGYFPEANFYEANTFDKIFRQIQGNCSNDLLLLDFKMPGMENYRGIKLLQEHFPLIPIVILSGMYTSIEARQALNTGARAFVSKSNGDNDLISTIVQVREGENHILLEDKNIFKANMEQLTKREIEVLDKLALGYSNKAIAKELFIEVGTLKTHLKSIYHKLDVSNRTQAVKILTDQLCM